MNPVYKYIVYVPIGTKKNGKAIIIIAMYMDDFYIFYDGQYNNLFSLLEANFDVKLRNFERLFRYKYN